MAEGGLKRRDPTVTRVARRGFTFDSFVEVAGKHNHTELEAQAADEQQKRDAHRPPLGALVVDVNVGDCEIQGGQHLRPRPYHLYPFFGEVRNHLRPEYGFSFKNLTFLTHNTCMCMTSVTRIYQDFCA